MGIREISAQKTIKHAWEAFNLRKSVAKPIAGTSLVRLFSTNSPDKATISTIDCYAPKSRQLPIIYMHCDVFTDKPLLGNGLSVFFVPPNSQITKDEMQTITREMKHFESTFITIPHKVTNHRVEYLTSPLEYLDNLVYLEKFQGIIEKSGSSIKLKLNLLVNNQAEKITLHANQIIQISINSKVRFLQLKSSDKELGDFIVLGLLGKNSTLSNEEIKFKLMQGLGHTIFYGYIPEITVKTRIFACSSELDFAGHPLLGTASVIHKKMFSLFKEIKVKLILNDERKVSIVVTNSGNCYYATMSQGYPTFLEQTINQEQISKFLKALNLTIDNYDTRYPIEVVSTGCKQLIIPIKSGINRAKIVVDKFEEMLKKVNAEFVYMVMIENTNESKDFKITTRTWENDGSSEDAATGSAAGPLGAYLVKHKIVKSNEIVKINQGEFINKSSQLYVQVIGDYEDVLVSGSVCMVGDGQIRYATHKLESS